MNEARVNPQGFIAQRLPQLSTDTPWLLVTADDDGPLNLQALTDDDVATWPQLTVKIGATSDRTNS